MKIILQEQNESAITTNLVPCDEFSLSTDKPRLPTDAILSKIHEKTVVILPPATNLFQQYSASEIFKFIHKLRCNAKVKQVYLWLRTKNFNAESVVPDFLRHMADILVTLSSKFDLEILIRKSGGNVTRKFYNYDTSDSIYVTEVKQKPKEAKTDQPTVVRPESLGTFKIELSEEDLVARNTLVLPFEKYELLYLLITFYVCIFNINILYRHLKIGEPVKNAENKGKIIYHPDKNDDFDEDDPDDDLDV